MPTIPILHDIVHNKFNLKFGSLKTTTLKYFEGTYEEKRIWVSRLLAQFHMDNAMIISIDESNIKSDINKS